MTDNTVDYAESNLGGVRIPCILDTGNITVSEAFKPNGMKVDTVTPTNSFVKGEWVQLSNDTAATYSATGGLPLVEKPAAGEDRIFGRIVSTPMWSDTMPTSSHTDGLADRLSNGYYMVAEVWVPFLTGIGEGVIIVDGSNAVAPGATTLDIDASESAGEDVAYFKYDASGSGFVALTHTIAGSSGDTYSILVGFTGGFGTVQA